VTRLVRCPSCRLLYRAPTDPPALDEIFYQRDYSEGYTTDCPRREDLLAFLKNHFIGSERDYSSKIAVVRALGMGSGARVLDYGASWGYGTWQLRASGYDTIGYEINRSRARYARTALGVPVHDTIKELVGPFDLFFCSHVLEHISALKELIRFAVNLLKSGGVFLAFTPNGCQERTSLHVNREEYRHIWGLVHPVLLDEESYRYAFAGQPTLLCSSPYDIEGIRTWSRNSDLILSLKGDELAVAVWK
jgi:hypothetical protein